MPEVFLVDRLAILSWFFSKCGLSLPLIQGILISAGSQCKNGEGEIRTPATLSGRPVFETGAFNHSATSPTRATLCDAGVKFQQSWVMFAQCLGGVVEIRNWPI
jgi:hypothetical protein